MTTSPLVTGGSVAKLVDSLGLLLPGVPARFVASSLGDDMHVPVMSGSAVDNLSEVILLRSTG